MCASAYEIDEGRGELEQLGVEEDHENLDRFDVHHLVLRVCLARLLQKLHYAERRRLRRPGLMMEDAPRR